MEWRTRGRLQPRSESSSTLVRVEGGPNYTTPGAAKQSAAA
ncbi:hypothetical protein A2U01_0064573, partial [Trifolium medium]|nr:hypothetical protein [Trifolium medium]